MLDDVTGGWADGIKVGPSVGVLDAVTDGIAEWTSVRLLDAVTGG